MLRSIVSSIEFEKFRRDWSETNSMNCFLRKLFETQHNAFLNSAFRWVAFAGRYLDLIL
ncbi:hypothetical protein LEP1GSC186_0809 [Leptospira noguchii serovar Autumnalis str. ZUN142]|uniref:Uncharacterized protein n=1 Tax=Leptospira noguchii serovar Autumnalis str. ZUN142 TaxID=1085540 RepID=M6UZA2_9LEPT|nr:hypothetical protein LEP1GSC186_0809 [Leptospira noguchii serovar Autumnalis str. ZUN142]